MRSRVNSSRRAEVTGFVLSSICDLHIKNCTKMRSMSALLLRQRMILPSTGVISIKVTIGSFSMSISRIDRSRRTAWNPSCAPYAHPHLKGKKGGIDHARPDIPPVLSPRELPSRPWHAISRMLPPIPVRRHRGRVMSLKAS